MFQETILSEFKGLASDVGGEISAIGNYDTKDVKGLLDNVDKDKIKSLVEKVKPLIPEYYDKAMKMATDIFNQGKTEFDKIREEVEKEVYNLLFELNSYNSETKLLLISKLALFDPEFGSPSSNKNLKNVQKPLEVFENVRRNFQKVAVKTFSTSGNHNAKQ